jgi:hypothetical protein
MMGPLPAGCGHATPSDTSESKRISLVKDAGQEALAYCCMTEIPRTNIECMFFHLVLTVSYS